MKARKRGWQYRSGSPVGQGPRWFTTPVAADPGRVAPDRLPSGQRSRLPRSAQPVWLASSLFVHVLLAAIIVIAGYLPRPDADAPGMAIEMVFSPAAIPEAETLSVEERSAVASGEAEPPAPEPPPTETDEPILVEQSPVPDPRIEPPPLPVEPPLPRPADLAEAIPPPAPLPPRDIAVHPDPPPIEELPPTETPPPSADRADASPEPDQPPPQMPPPEPVPPTQVVQPAEPLPLPPPAPPKPPAPAGRRAAPAQPRSAPSRLAASPSAAPATMAAALPLSTLPAPGPAEVSPGWRSALAAWLQQHKTYPAAARARGEQGGAAVRFTVTRDGQVIALTLAHGSGSAILDRAVQDLLEGARVPPFPADMPHAQVTVTVRITYSLER